MGGSGDMLCDRHTRTNRHRQTETLITVLCQRGVIIFTYLLATQPSGDRIFEYIHANHAKNKISVSKCTTLGLSYMHAWPEA